MKRPTNGRSLARRSAAAVAVAATLTAVGVGGAMAANADPAPSHTQQDGELNDDATDTGPDANANEPGHQDASDAQTSDGDGEQNDAAEADNDGEQNDATEVESDGEQNDDATDTGPDANPNEPGHQDASDAQSGAGD